MNQTILHRRKINTEQSFPPQHAEHLKSMLRKEPSLGEQLIYLNKIATALQEESPTESVKYARKALRIGKELGSNQQILKSYELLGNYYQHAEDLKKALSFFKRKLRLCESLKDPAIISSCLVKIGSIHQKMEEYGEAIQVYEQALTIEREIAGTNWELELVKKLGVLYYLEKDYNKAHRCFLTALNLALELGDKVMQTKIYHHLGNVYQKVGDNKNAIAHYLKALRLNKRNGNKSKVVINLNNIGIVYYKLKDYTKAIQFFSEAIDLSTKTENSKEIAKSLGLLGKVYEDMEIFDAAVNSYGKALKIYQRIDNKTGVANRLENLGFVYNKIGNYVKAEFYFKESVKICKKLSNKPLLAKGLENLGNLSLKKRKYEEAVRFFQKSIKLSKNNGNSLVSNDIYRHLANCYGKLGDFERAYKTQLEFQSIKPAPQEQKPRDAEYIQSKLQESEMEKMIQILKVQNQDYKDLIDKGQHQIKERVRVIECFSQLLYNKHKKSLNADGLEFLTIVKNETSHLQKMMLEMSLFHQLIDPDHLAEKTNVDLNEIVHIATKNLAGIIDDSSASINYEQLPRCYGNPELLVQVFEIIISNSIKYRSSELPIIDISTKRSGRNLRITVSDNGVGVPDDQYTKIFDLYTRLYSRKEYEGNGLGLAILHKIVSRMGGRVWAEGNMDHGVVINIDIPRS